jgi:hypothetical protein
MRREIERNISRYYNRKRQYPQIRRSYQTHCRSMQQVIIDDTVKMRNWTKPSHFYDSTIHLKENSHLKDLEIKKECLLQRSDSELENWFKIWAKHHIHELNSEEIQELEKFLDQLSKSQIDGDLEKISTKSQTGVVERFQAWLFLAQYSRSFQNSI